MRNRKRTGKKKFEKDNIRDNKRLTDTGALSKHDRYVDERERRDYHASSANDPMWYAQNAQLLSDYASLPFGAPLGLTMDASLNLGDRPTALPGVMALYYEPTIGIAQNETDAVTIAARNIYSFVRHANSGHTNYDAPDLMLYLLAMDSVYMFHEYMKRALGVVLDYTPTNRYYPRALLQAMGIDPEDLSAHIADFRGYINEFAVRMGSLCVPNSMSYMARHSWMASGLYTDAANSDKAQTYMYVPYAFYVFGLNAQSGAGELRCTQLFDPTRFKNFANDTPLLTFEDLRTFGNTLLTPIITNEDMNIMSGDILKAFTDSGIVKVSGVLDGYMVLPVYSAEVLSQIENCTILGWPLTSNVVQQNTAVGGGYLSATYTGYATASTTLTSMPDSVQFGDKMWSLLEDSRLLNFHHNPVSPADVMVATRLSAVCDVPAGKPTILQAGSAIVQDANGNNVATVPMQVTYCGSELVTYANFYYYQKVGSLPLALNTATVKSVMWHYGGGTLWEISAMSGLEAFDWHPIVYPGLLSAPPIGTGITIQGAYWPMVDIDTYTTITPNILRNLHTTAILSEFSVPQLGRLS